MKKSQFLPVSLRRFILNNAEVIASNVFLTGNAIALWSINNDGITNLDLWDWHEDVSSGCLQYIVTDMKKIMI